MSDMVRQLIPTGRTSERKRSLSEFAGNLRHHNSQVHYVHSFAFVGFLGDLSNYTFLETTEYKDSKNQCFHFPRLIYGGHIGFPKNEYFEVILLLIIDKTVKF